MPKLSVTAAILLLAALVAACAPENRAPEPEPSPDPADVSSLAYADSSAGWVVLDQFRDQLGGGVVDRILNPQDQRQYRNAAGEALERKPEGQKTSWYNPLTGRGGEFTINAAFRSPDGRPCKRLTQRVLADGQAHVLQSVACQRGDDSWGGFEG